MKPDLPAGVRVDGTHVSFHFIDEKTRLETVISVQLSDKEAALIETVFERLKANLAPGIYRPMRDAEIDAFRSRIAASVRLGRD